MRHHNKNRKFGRVKNQRKALLKSLTRSLIVHGKISTTLAKAKELRPTVEGLVTKAKREGIHSKRLVLSRVSNERRILKKLFEEIAPKYKTRHGGYTRITKLPRRKSDGSEMAVIEFV